MRVLTWNLFHGRSVPDTPRSLLEEFAAALGGWEWDVALLQEVPPWWTGALAARCGRRDAPRSDLAQRAACRSAGGSPSGGRTLIKSNGGGANAILVRGRDRRRRAGCRVRVWPERRCRCTPSRLADGDVGRQHPRHDAPRRAHAGGPRPRGRRAGPLGGGAPGPAGRRHEHRPPATCRATPTSAATASTASSGAASRRPRPAVTLDTHGLSDHAAVVVEVVRSGA